MTSDFYLLSSDFKKVCYTKDYISWTNIHTKIFSNAHNTISNKHKRKLWIEKKSLEAIDPEGFGSQIYVWIFV